MKDVVAEVIENVQLSKSYYKLVLKTGWSSFQPGQFVMVRIPDGVAFTRRPFSIMQSHEKDIIEICYKLVGAGTRRLALLRSGEKIETLGPLGTGFWYPEGMKAAVVIAGGFGIAPFVGMFKTLVSKGVRTSLFYGGRGLEDILFLDQFEAQGVECHISTEDGSLGHKGVVTELLSKYAHNNMINSNIFCCGPKGLLDVVLRLSKKHSIPAQVSYETYMGCGIGVCLGCAVKTRDGYKRACKEGPVFSSEVL